MTGRLADPPLAEGHAEESAGKLADGFEEKAAAKAAPDSRLTRRRFLLGSAAAAAGVALYSGEIARHEILSLIHI